MSLPFFTSDTILSKYYAQSSLDRYQAYAPHYQSSWPISWEFLHGLKLYLKNKQNNSTFRSAIHPIPVGWNKWGTVRKQSKVLCPEILRDIL